MKEVILEAQNLSKIFSNGQTKNKVLDNIDLKIYDKDFTVIMGKSGAGKSTLLYALSGMDKITSGKINYKAKEISKLNEKQMAKIRTKDFGFIFQQAYLINTLTLFENIVISGYLDKETSSKQIDNRAKELIKQMNIENAKERLASQASGGELQRTAVARAMINNPKLIFADEPTGALNKSNTEEVLNLLTCLNKNEQSILMVTHDIKAAIRGNRLLYIEDGKIMGEKELLKFDGNNLKQREEEVDSWLSQMEW